MVEQEVTESGSNEFQIAGPADLKPREPNTELTCGTQSRWSLEERRASEGTEGWMKVELSSHSTP